MIRGDSPPISIQGRLFQKGESAFVRAEICRNSDGTYRLESVVDPAQIVEIAHIAPQVGAIPAMLTLADGRRFESDTALPMGFVDHQAANFVRILERFSIIKSVGIVCAIIVFLALFRIMVPQVSDVAVVIVPTSFDNYLGDEVEEFLEGSLVTPSNLPPNIQQDLRLRLDPMRNNVLGHTNFASAELLFRDSDLMGANAFALPNGTITMTDDLVNMFADAPDQLAAIYAHELAHVEARHGMRQLLRYTLMSVLIFSAGVDESLIEEIALVFSQVTRAGYTRDFEREADLRAAQILRQNNLDPMELARALLMLEETLCGEVGCDEGSLFATHPDISERVRRIENYAKRQ